MRCTCCGAHLPRGCCLVGLMLSISNKHQTSIHLPSLPIPSELYGASCMSCSCMCCIHEESSTPRRCLAAFLRCCRLGWLGLGWAGGCGGLHSVGCGCGVLCFDACGPLISTRSCLREQPTLLPTVPKQPANHPVCHVWAVPGFPLHLYVMSYST